MFNMKMLVSTKDSSWQGMCSYQQEISRKALKGMKL